MARGEGARLHVGGEGGDGDGVYAVEGDLVGGGEGEVTVAEEGALRGVGHGPGAVVGKGVVEAHVGLMGAEVEAVHASLGAVHAAAVCPVAVVEEFAGQTGEAGAFPGGEDEPRDGRTVLTEVYHECLTLAERHVSPLGVLPEYDYPAMLLVGLAHRVLPHVGHAWRQGEVVAVIYLCSLRGQYLAPELPVHLGGGEWGHVLVGHGQAGIVFLTVVDGCMLHGACHAGLPVDGVGAEMLRGAVGVGQAEDSAEGALGAVHAVGAAGGDDLVSPPSRSDLDGEHILLAALALHGLRHVVGEGAFCLEAVGESGFQHLLSYCLAVDIELIYAESCCHPSGCHHLLPVLLSCHEPVGSVGRPGSVVHPSPGDGCVDHGYPLRLLPQLWVEWLGHVSGGCGLGCGIQSGEA